MNYASATTQQFYNSDLYLASEMPLDAQPISDELHQELMQGQIDGRLIDFSVTPPCLVDRPVVYATAAQLSAKIDTRIADIYATWTRFEAEYLFREAAAIKFRDAGYTGDAGIWIEAFADAAGLGLQVACDLILSQSANLRAAQEALGALRMRKYEIAPLTGAAAAAKYDEICAAITLVASQIS